ncbi:hypothetical protein OS493_027715, partial [Desmophyllum pertusum]
MQAISLAKLYTLEKDNNTAVNQFKQVLESRDMFFNAQIFPANESGDAAFSGVPLTRHRGCFVRLDGKLCRHGLKPRL